MQLNNFDCNPTLGGGEGGSSQVITLVLWLGEGAESGCAHHPAPIETRM